MTGNPRSAETMTGQKGAPLHRAVEIEVQLSVEMVTSPNVAFSRQIAMSGNHSLVGMIQDRKGPHACLSGKVFDQGVHLTRNQHQTVMLLDLAIRDNQEYYGRSKLLAS